jgi:hypothetical protein
MMTTTSTSSQLPAWHRRWNQYPVASGAWITVKLPAHERATLIATQKAWDELMAGLPRASIAGKERWLGLRTKYAQTRDPAVLAELSAIGERGTILTEQLRVKGRTIKEAARRLASTKGCKPIYVHAFRQAVAIVLQRIQADEKAERQACAQAKLDFNPSEFLWSLANLASRYQTDAENYGQENPESDPAILAAPADALGDLWRGIKEGK